MKNPYKTLGVHKGQKDDEIRAVYYRRMSAAHPDKGGTQEAATTITLAYAQIKNKTTRKALDSRLGIQYKRCEMCSCTGFVYVRLKKQACGRCFGCGYV